MLMEGLRSAEAIARAVSYTVDRKGLLKCLSRAVALLDPILGGERRHAGNRPVHVQ